MAGELSSEAHRIFRSYQGNKHNKQDEIETVPGIVHPGATGVIYCTDRAEANGFSATDPSWANLGQGAPETGPLPDSPPRIASIDFISLGGDEIHEYAPTSGLKSLREAVANYYNKEYREGMESQYTYENVCITPGGRAGMSRLAAVIGNVYVGYQIPEYTTYSEMLSVFKNLVPIPTALTAENMYRMNLKTLETEIENLSLGVIVASNPRNPTGQVIDGDELKQLIEITRDKATLMLDEFYSWYVYPDDPKELGTSVSGARYVRDVNKDSIVLINGLTKGWRLPGWRIGWVVGPKNLISALSQSGSFLDGGASHVLQAAAVPLLDHEFVQKEKLALQKTFRLKRDYVLDRLKKIGLEVKVPPKSTFYIWLDLSKLPEPLNSGMVMFEELLKEKCIVVPGLFFDINPSKRRDLFHSPCHHFVRISFGPPMEHLEKGMDAFERVLAKHQAGGGDLMGKNLKRSQRNETPVYEFGAGSSKAPKISHGESTSISSQRTAKTGSESGTASSKQDTSSTRSASHAGSWYSSNPSTLSSELRSHLSKVTVLPDLKYDPPISSCRAIIAPHAGYSYSGPAAAWAYAAIPTKSVKRVFLLGPSHHFYLDKMALTRFKKYGTPLGDLEVDVVVVNALRRTGEFDMMDASTDEDEHSLEMHLPYIRQVFGDRTDIKLVPVLVGSVSPTRMKHYATLLREYYSDPSNFFIVSSDFCHWGSRFQYTKYYPSIPELVNPVPPVPTPSSPSSSSSSSSSASPGTRTGPPTMTTLTRSSRLKSTDTPIWESIQFMDHEALSILRHAGTPGTSKLFREYLARTENTICGRNPILALLAILEDSRERDGEEGGKKESEMVFVRYEQSSKCLTLRDSSVSYVSGVVIEKR